MRILLHVCCGPCAIYPVKFLRQSGYEPLAYFFNPNIHPYREFSRRIETLREYSTLAGLELVIDDRYLLEDFLAAAMRETNRCLACYRMRLEQAASYAAETGLTRFTTTLLVSPYQQHELIRKVGEEAGARYGVAFEYFDFRPGWPEGVVESRALNLYRQPYCGCIFSERDRYLKKR